MEYNILYIEDGDPSSIISDLQEDEELKVEYHDPQDFEKSINKVKTSGTDLLLLDFRLSDKKGVIYDAPTLAQTIRTVHANDPIDLPIVLISSEEKISEFYKDYTSLDLFDMAISKMALSEQSEKYHIRIKSVIKAYSALRVVKGNSQPLLPVLNIPDLLNDKFDLRIKDLLDSSKYKNNIFMASDFILNQIVRPSGILIGEDILAARLGVSLESGDWNTLKSILDEFKYSGLYSDAYERWWFIGVENWWKSISPENSSLKRLRASEKVSILKAIFELPNLQEATKDKYSKSDYFWTICNKYHSPLDPIDGFEKNSSQEPWQDKSYFSIEAVSSLESLTEITAIDKRRYIEYTKE